MTDLVIASAVVGFLIFIRSAVLAWAWWEEERKR